MTGSVVLAHLAGGHWMIDLGTYLVPFLLILGLLKWSDRRAARRAEVEGVPREKG